VIAPFALVDEANAVRAPASQSAMSEDEIVIAL
jgi:hypothetical protein